MSDYMLKESRIIRFLRELRRPNTAEEPIEPQAYSIVSEEPPEKVEDPELEKLLEENKRLEEASGDPSKHIDYIFEKYEATLSALSEGRTSSHEPWDPFT